MNRKLTQEAAKQFHTESALVELYEHVRKMPESAQKRKLMKKINRVPNETTTPASTGACFKTKRGMDVMGSIRVRRKYHLG